MDIYDIRHRNYLPVLKQAGGPTALAEALGKQPSQLSQYTSRIKQIGSVVARQIEKAAGKPAGWMDQNHEQIFHGDASSIDDDNWLDITAYSQHASTGDGAEPDEYAETSKLKFKASSFKKKGLYASKTSVYYSKGDSMEPRIKSGDALLFDQSDTTRRDDKIFIISWKGQLHAKRLIKIGKHWGISSDNADDPKWKRPHLIEESDDLTVIGRVRWIGSWED